MDVERYRVYPVKLLQLGLLLALCFQSCLAFTEDSALEIYGNLPGIRSVVISPDGKHYAFIRAEGDNEYFVVTEVGTGEIKAAANASSLKARSLFFVTNKHLILRASQTTRTPGYRGRLESSAAFSFNIETEKVRMLLRNTKDIHPAQSGLGRILGFNEAEELVYMPAFHQYGTNPYNLYKVKLSNGRGKVHAKGTKHTLDWFVGDNGVVLAREEYDEDEKEHRIQSKLSGSWETVYSLKTALRRIGVEAVSADQKSLLIVKGSGDREAVYSLSLVDGTIDGPLFSRDEADIEYLDTNFNRQLTAIVYTGFTPDYEFVDPRETKLYDRLSTTFPMSSVYYESVTKDKKKAIVKVSGAEGSGTYMLFDTEQVQLFSLASEYKVDAIAELKAIRYSARDDLSIPAIVTYPIGIEKQENLPLIVLPHGGPESYDNLHFDWLAQYFANKGYLVLQPNFRGSTGFGYQFRYAGRGLWGKEMQDDVSDGVGALVEAGYADPARVCIVGASYGGYSALAGGAFTPELYRCVISINGVSDLPRMLRDDRRKHGYNHWVISYWEKLLGSDSVKSEQLKNISPVNFASAFRAPTLLIHGRDDTVVPIMQSEKMAKALKKEGKDVSLLRLKGEDHHLSSSSTRLAMLKAIGEFLDEHNPAH